MKKFTVLMAAAAMVLSANAADYYLIGGFNGWATADAACKFTEKSETEYVLDYNGTLTNGFKINDGTWTNDAANFGSNGNGVELGVAYTCGVGGSSANINFADVDGVENPHIVFDPTTATLTISGKQAEVTKSYDLWGDLTAAGGAWSSTALVEKDGKWSASFTAAAKGAFGIRELGDGVQTAWISAAGDGVIVLNEEIGCQVEGTNFSFTNGGDYTLTFDPSAMTLYVTGKVVDPIDPPVEGDDFEAMYLVGAVTGWGADEAYKMTTTDGIVYTLTCAMEAGSEFKFFGGAWGTRELTIASNDPLPNGTYTMENSDSNINLMYGGDAVTFTITLAAKQDFSAAQLTIAGQDQGAVSYPETVYVVGSFTDMWTLDSAIALENKGAGLYTVTVKGPFKGDAEGRTMFRFLTEKSWDEGVNYGAAMNEGDNVEVSLNETGGVDGEWHGDVVVGGRGNWYFNCEEMGDKELVINLDLANNKVQFGQKGVVEEGETGVEVVNAVAGEVLYFNLQGARVANPENGLYIRVENGKAQKVLVK